MSTTTRSAFFKQFLWVLLALVVLCGGHVLRFEPFDVSEHSDLARLLDEGIDHVNSLNTTWKAGRNFHPTQAQMMARLVAQEGRAYKKLNDVTPLPETTSGSLRKDVTMPESFDAREKWPKCKSLNQIRDQGNCGGSWAMAAAAAISDRICVHANGAKNPIISAINIVSCWNLGILGCQGYLARQAWHKWVVKGFVTGEPYGSNEGCQPWVFKHCDHVGKGGKYPECLTSFSNGPRCKLFCTSTGYNRTFEEDLHFGEKYFILDTGEKIQQEVYFHGPVETTIDVYTDFFGYKSGVYQYNWGTLMGIVSVRILGWGVENGTPYWLAANNWNSGWGDHGYFKILRGKNECQVENDGWAGYPRGDSK
ncbi:hypothetical protein ACOMHN_041965 [Nucella lapillus]